MNLTGGLKPDYELSQERIAEALFLSKNSVQRIEIRAMESFKRELANRGITLEDLLQD